MELHSLKRSTKLITKTRVGRGIAAGQGKTAGRGTKGQKSRSGYNLPKKFEGGQTPLILRLPKVRGTKHARVANQTVDRLLINTNYQDGEIVSPTTLLSKGLIKSSTQPVKILGKSVVTKQVTFEDVKLSKQSQE